MVFSLCCCICVFVYIYNDRCSLCKDWQVVRREDLRLTRAAVWQLRSWILCREAVIDVNWQHTQSCACREGVDMPHTSDDADDVCTDRA